MNPIQRIRQRLGMTQVDLAKALGKSQSNISHYERGRQKVPPAVAHALVAVAKTRGKRVTLSQIYGPTPKANK
jgi:transcriptional regulator with XRE-family HTH domain